MGHDWLLVETLGNEPVVVAQGTQPRNLVPITAFLRRNPHLAAIRMAIAESMRTRASLVATTPTSDRVVRTEPVVMSDGRLHGVHVWCGAAVDRPPERAVPGPLKWDLTIGVATGTRESLANSGKNPDVEPTHGRSFADDLPTRELNPSESKVLALAIKAQPGQTMCGTWDVTDWRGNPIRVGFVARSAIEPGADGCDHLIARAMNWRAEPECTAGSGDRLAQQIVQGLAQPGVHRALFDLKNWSLLKWLDEPCPFYDWRSTARSPRVHPDDEQLMASMTTEFAHGATARVLRLPGHDGTWTPLHVTVNRIEVEDKTFAGLISLRVPTDNELAEAGLSPSGNHTG